MFIKPFAALTLDQVNTGKRLSIFDGIATELMTTLTGGTLLTAMAIYAGATNFQIGVLAALPSFTNIFQLFAIWLVFRFRNRKMIAVMSGILARTPLILIGLFPFLFSMGTSVELMILLLSFHYFFGSLAGPGWNSWMKDMIPINELGNYFSHRGRIIQIVSVSFGLMVGLLIDWMKTNHASMLIFVHAWMFIIGGIAGLLGTYFMAKTAEPAMDVSNPHIFSLMKAPLRDKNFLKLLCFQGTWSFALALAVPFYAVFLLKTIELPLSYLIGFNLVTQLFSIVAIKFWGRLSDRISNKTILFICGPLYACTILCWPMLTLAGSKHGLFWMLVGIHAVTGISTSGINLSIGNIGLKLADKETAVAYIVWRGMAMACVSSLATLLSGALAFSSQTMIVLFLLSGFGALVSLQLLRNVVEPGEKKLGQLLKRVRQRIFVS